MMRAVALAGRRAALQTRASVSTAPLCRFLSSGGREPPSNPFEIDLSLSSTSSTATTLSLDDAKRAAEGQQAEAQREIELLHREMSSLFGEEVAEPSSSGSSSGVEAAFDMEVAGESSAVESGESSVGAVEEAPGVTSKPAVKDQPKKRKTARQKKALGAGMAEERSSQTATKESSTAVGEVDDRPPSVLVVMGPCSVMQGFWTGGNILLSELRSQVRTQSDELKIKSKMRVSNVESDVLELILKAQPDQVVVLGWNISLSKSPFVLHALELIKASVIIVSPNGVDHGPLPSNVVGVLAGFRDQSMSMAVAAASKLVLKSASGDIAALQRREVSGRNGNLASQQNTKASRKKPERCYYCGKEGHKKFNCPKLAKKVDG